MVTLSSFAPAHPGAYQEKTAGYFYSIRARLDAAGRAGFRARFLILLGLY